MSFQKTSMSEPSFSHSIRARGPHPVWATPVLAGLLISLSPGLASAQESSRGDDAVAACLSNHTKGQMLRQAGKLIESRDVFRQCSAVECPSQVIRDCLGWLEQTQRQIPSVSFRILADGVTRTDARVFIDGQAVLERVSGKALDLNPGVHELRVVLPPFEEYEADLVVSDGEQFRVVEVAFRTPVAPKRPLPPTAPEVEMHRPIPIPAYVFAGVAAAAAISGTGWGLSTRLLEGKLEDKCAPRCSQEGIDVVKQRALLADLSWGIGAASLITAVTFYVLRPEVPVTQDTVGLDVSMIPSGAIGTLSLTGF